MNRRGLTIAELMLAIFVLFLAGSFTVGSLILASQSTRRVEERSIATILSQGTLEQLSVLPKTAIVPGTYSYAGAYSAYLYDVSLTPFAPPASDLNLLTVNVRTPAGVGVADEILLSGVTFQGMVATEGLDAWSSFASTTNVLLYTDAPAATNPVPMLPSGAAATGLAADFAFNNLWAADSSAPNIYQMTGPMTGSGVWGPAIPGPTAGLLAGLYWCDTTNSLWAVDRTNKTLWRRTGAGTWAGPYSPAAPLVDPTGVTVIDPGTEVWVADAGANGLRRYIVSTNTWDPTLYAPPGGMGIPINVDRGQFGINLVWTADTQNAYAYDYAASTWQTIPMPAALTASVPVTMDFHDPTPSGDPSDKDVEIYCANGQVWEWDTSGGGWQEKI